MVSPMRPASDYDRIDSNITIWHGYDSAVKAELYATCLATPGGRYLIDPIPLESAALDELLGSGGAAGIIVTNSNHHRAAVRLATEFSAPVFGHGEIFPHKPPHKFRTVADGDKICEGLTVIGIEGAADGEIALYYAPNGGTFIVGDALINFEPYGFTLLPAKYCSNQKQMRQSLRKLLDYEAESILFAHGTPILAGASDRLKSLLRNGL
jgi:glyoxylase-like metal-dependent hydrolase (beta-lactamase superfamily II)